MLCCYHLEILKNFKQEASHLHSALDPANYAAGLAHKYEFVTASENSEVRNDGNFRLYA